MDSEAMTATVRLGLVVVLLLLIGCDNKPAAPIGRAAEKVTIVASVYPLADVARHVGGEAVTVSWIVEKGEAVEGLNPSAEARSRLRTSDLLLAGGITEPWAVEGASDAFQHGRVIRLDTLKARSGQTTVEGYPWLDPLLVVDGCTELSNRLSLLRPEKELMIRAQSEAFVKQLTDFTNSYQQKFYQTQNKRILVLGSEYSTLLRRFGLSPIPTVINSPSRLSDADFRTIREIATEHNTRLLLLSDDTPPLLVKDIEVRASVQVIRLDALGSSGAKGRTSYLDLLKHDLEQLLHATSVR